MRDFVVRGGTTRQAAVPAMKFNHSAASADKTTHWGQVMLEVLIPGERTDA
jgi:hypothetical protein